MRCMKTFQDAAILWSFQDSSGQSWHDLVRAIVLLWVGGDLQRSLLSSISMILSHLASVSRTECCQEAVTGRTMCSGAALTLSARDTYACSLLKSFFACRDSLTLFFSPHKQAFSLPCHLYSSILLVSLQVVTYFCGMFHCYWFPFPLCGSAGSGHHEVVSGCVCLRIDCLRIDI